MIQRFVSFFDLDNGAGSEDTEQNGGYPRNRLTGEKGVPSRAFLDETVHLDHLGETLLSPLALLIHHRPDFLSQLFVDLGMQSQIVDRVEESTATRMDRRDVEVKHAMD